jgi:hypothetical protein
MGTFVDNGQREFDTGLTDAVGSNDTRARWGVNAGPWLWASRLRILFVIDGPVDPGPKPGSGFGLGPVLDTLRDPGAAWWVRFEVDVAKREGPASETLFPGPYGLRYRGFRFTQPGFDIDAYDQVWFFGFHPGNDGGDDSNIEAENFFPLELPELKVLAEFMDRGGGVFAAGDHDYLGASMCHRIPRVRTMRKWTHAQGVPPKDADTRNQTLSFTHIPQSSLDDQEGDQFSQPSEPVYSNTVGSSPLFFDRVPHPLLCINDRVIDRFPDHMHEGEVIEDDKVQLDIPLEIPGYDGVEYPFVPQIVAPVAAAAAISLPLERPRPRVIAHGRATNQVKRFALIGVYDGDRAGIGRVVVDSTWHHWFSMNLIGFQTLNRPVYEGMQAYYRNVGLWLATPEQRASLLFAGVWGVLTGLGPMAFTPRTSPWEVGRRVTGALRRTMSTCMLTELVSSFLDAEAVTLRAVPPGQPSSEPCWSCLPLELLNRAIVGGIGAGLLQLAYDFHEQLNLGNRPRLDPDAIRRHAAEGATEGHRLMTEALARAATDYAYLRDRVARGFAARPVESISVPVEVIALRVVAERLQFPDASDPTLADGHLTLTGRVRLDGSVIAARTLEGLEIPALGARGGLLDLDWELANVLVQTGERLTVELLIGRWTWDEVESELVRFEDAIDGDPSGWVGNHTPKRTQPWRLWYRIERADSSSSTTAW